MLVGASTPTVRTPYVFAWSAGESQGFVDGLGGQTEGMTMVTFNLNKEQQSNLFEAELARLSELVADMEAIREGVHPESLADGPAPVLDRWMIAQRAIPCLAGLSFGHPKLAGDQRMIATSDLWLLSDDRSWARTLSRWYRLGRPAGHPADHS